MLMHARGVLLLDLLRSVCAQDPVSYAQKALALNEFGAPRWQAVLTATGQPVGEVVLAQRGLPGPEETWCALLLTFTHCLHAPLPCTEMRLARCVFCVLCHH